MTFAQILPTPLGSARPKEHCRFARSFRRNTDLVSQKSQRDLLTLPHHNNRHECTGCLPFSANDPFSEMIRLTGIVHLGNT